MQIQFNTFYTRLIKQKYKSDNIYNIKKITFENESIRSICIVMDFIWKSSWKVVIIK